MLPSYSGLKSKPSIACYLLLACFLLGLFFSPEDEGDRFLQNIS
jgi:hypothetical protein